MTVPVAQAPKLGILREIPAIFSSFDTGHKGIIPGDQYPDIARRVRERVASSFMLELYTRHTVNRDRPGLYLFPSATGSGKTYQACELMAMWIVAFDMGEPQRPVYFMTPLKKNLPDRKELVDHMAGLLADRPRRGAKLPAQAMEWAGMLYDRYVIRLNNNTDSLVAALCGSSRYLNDRIDHMDKCIRRIRRTAPHIWNTTRPGEQHPLIVRLGNAIHSYQGAGGYCPGSAKDPGAKKAKPMYVNVPEQHDTRQRLDPLVHEFLTIVHEHVSDAIKDWWNDERDEEENKHPLGNADRIRFVRESPVWDWIPELIPHALHTQYPVKLMSAKKFLHGTTPVITPHTDFLEPKNLKEAIVLMDESDAIKQVMTGYLIDQSTDNALDVIQLMTNVRHAIADASVPRTVENLLTRTDNHGRTLAERLRDVREEMDRIWDRHHLGCAYQLRPDLRHHDRSSYLLRRSMSTSVFNGNRRPPECRYDKTDRKVWLEIPPDDKDGQYFSITQILGQCQGALTLFAQFIALLARERLGWDLMYGDALARRQCVYTLLNDYTIYAKEDKQALLAMVEATLVPFKDKHKIQAGGDGFTLYNYPLDIYQMVDSPYSADRSEFRRYELSVMPEHLLLRMASHANVLAMSATATLNTPFRNFDLDYLHDCLGKRYGMPDHQEVKVLEDEYHQRQVTPQVAVDVMGSYRPSDQFGFDQFGEQTCRLFSKRVTAMRTKLYASGAHAGDTGDSDLNPYYLDVYHKLVSACIRMLRDDDTRSMLCFLNGYPKDKDTPIKKNLLKEAVELAWVMHLAEQGVADADTDYAQLPDKAKVYFQVMTTANQNTVSREWQEPLRTGRKTIIVTVYSGFATGQNLQHSYDPKGYPGGDPAKNHTRNIRGRVKREKDFDAAFLLSPTHVVAGRLNAPYSSEQFVKNTLDRCLQIAYLDATGELLDHEANAHIGAALDNKLPGHELFETNATRLAVDSVVIQAIGRLCRTNVKAKRVHLYLDETLIDTMAPVDTGAMMMNDETRAVFKELARRDIKPCRDTADDQRLDRINDSGRHIRLMCNVVLGHTPWDDKDRKREQEVWTVYREILARHPYLADREALARLKDNAVALLDQDNPRGNYLRNLIDESYLAFDRPVREYWARQDRKEGDSQFAVYDQLSATPEFGKDWWLVNAQSMRYAELSKIEGLESLFDPIPCPFPDSTFMANPVVARNICQGAIGELAGAMLFEQLGAGKCVPIRNSDHMELADGQLEDYENAFVDFKNWNIDRPDEGQRRKDAGKALRLGARVLFIANIMGEFDPEYEPYDWQAWRRGADGEPEEVRWDEPADTRVVYLPTLVSLQNGHWRPDPAIGDVIRYHLNYDQQGA